MLSNSGLKRKFEVELLYGDSGSTAQNRETLSAVNHRDSHKPEVQVDAVNR